MMAVQCSVVIPAYNAAPFIRASVSSVLAQTNAPDFEVIVVDDGSTDGTAEIVAERFPMVRLIRKKNGGPASARNLGVQLAQSDIILFHDADDIMLEERISHQVAFMMMNPDVGVSFGSPIKELHPDDCEVAKLNIEANGEEYGIVTNAYRRLVTVDNIVVGTCAAIRRSVYLAAGGQPEDVMVGEDHALYIAVARHHPIAATRKKYTWYRQSHGTNLMASRKVYVGRLTVIGREIEKNHKEWDPELRRDAFVYFNNIFNSFARFYWAYEPRRELRLALSRWRPFLTFRNVLVWRTVPLVLPPVLGRSIRDAKHRLLTSPKRAGAASRLGTKIQARS